MSTHNKAESHIESMPPHFDDQPMEVERYELREAPKYQFSANRREFVQTLGAGLMIAVASRRAVAQPPGGRGGGGGSRRESLGDRFHIAEDGMVTVLTSKVEVGQDARTQITQAAAEELDLPPSRLRVIMADTAQCPDDGGTAGSRTTPATVPRVRSAAAAARELLIELAAESLAVDRSSIRYSEGVFSHGPARRVTLAELAKQTQLADRLRSTRPNNVELKRVAEWKVLGSSVPKVNGPEVVTGRSQYPSDIRRPGMKYGSILRAPTYGQHLESVDLDAVKAQEGVEVVRDGDFLGCVAATSWEARQAVAVLAASARWTGESAPVSSDTLFEHLKASSSRSGGGQGRSRSDQWGNGHAQLDATQQVEGAKSFSADYTVAYIQHAPMEPRAAVAEWNEGNLTVWTGTQQPARVQGQLASAFRMGAERVRVIVPDTGGGFGGKHTGEAAVEAARLALATGTPVSLRWTREEEFIWAYFRPAGLIEVRASLDQEGNINCWDFANYNSGGSAIGTPYEIPHGRTQFLPSDSPLRPGSYRALASAANTFARESAMDELADLAGVDPLTFRRNHLAAGRLKDVLEAAAKKFDWDSRRSNLAEHHGIGLACGTEKGSFAAACVEVAVIDNRLEIVQVCQAYECGAIQNPVNLQAQVEGCLLMGLGGALWEAIEFREGRILNPTFSSYRVPRMSDLPELDIVLVDRRDLPSVGAGETPIIPLAPAIANAIAHATGQRCRSLPLSSSIRT